MPLLSVVIITYNEERNIERCLQSIAGIADEIVVVDSLSTDGTKTICQQYGVRFITQSFLGYIEQKNFAKTQATHPYVLSLDADEALSLELRLSISTAKAQGFKYDIYGMSRCTNFCGKFIKHGTWYPDKKLRLFNNQKAVWGGTNPHDTLETTTSSTITYLKGDILHYSFYTIEELVAQTNKFTTIQATAMWQQGKKASYFKIIYSPLWAFLSGYFFRMGFLDGKDGLLIAYNVAYQTLLKYSKLLHLQQKQNLSAQQQKDTP